MEEVRKEKFLKKSIIQEMTENVGEQDTFVTAGAYMYCTMGTHEEVLNQLESNGTYINNTALMTVADCKVSTSTPDTWDGIPYQKPGDVIDGNIYSFGYCRSPLHPLKIADMNGTIPEPSFMYDYDPDTKADFTSEQDRIYPCVPDISSPTLFNPFGINFGPTQWQNGNEKVLINGVPALTNKSCLNCKYGGKIGFLSNGMEPVPGEFSDK